MMPPVTITYEVSIDRYVVTDDNTDLPIPGAPNFASRNDAADWCEENGYTVSL